jgi:toxin YoeB
VSGWGLVYSRQAQKDARKLAAAGWKPKAQLLLELIADDAFAAPPRVEKLVVDLAGCYSRRINIQHRLVYEVDADQRVVHVLRMGTPTSSR